MNDIMFQKIMALQMDGISRDMEIADNLKAMHGDQVAQAYLWAVDEIQQIAMMVSLSQLAGLPSELRTMMIDTKSMQIGRAMVLMITDPKVLDEVMNVVKPQVKQRLDALFKLVKTESRDD